MHITTPLLQVQNLSISFHTKEGKVQAVKEISFEIRKGEAVAIVGESGSGKTVTALSLMQLLPQQAVLSSGHAVFSSEQLNSVDLYKLGEKQLQKVRGREMSMIYQDPMSSLNPIMSCGKQVAEALLIHFPISKKEAYSRTLQLFELVKLPQPERMFKSYPHELSGGQKQRIIIAMAMACNPALLIADEPTTALDVTVQASILQLLNELRVKKEMAMLFISHDLSVVAQVADRIMVMYQGKIVEEGTVSQIFGDPQHPYTKALLSCRPTMTTQQAVLPTISDFMAGEANSTNANGTTVQVQQGTSVENGGQKSSISTNLQATSSSTEPLLQVQDIHVEFMRNRVFVWQKKELLQALRGVSFEVFPGETLGIVGESGCGKTTLGRTLIRLIEPTSGKVVFNGQNWADLPKEELRRARKNFQMIFQDPFSAMNPYMKIGEAIMEPMEVHKVLPTQRERKQRTLELLETVGLLPEHFHRYPQEFSGGQLQRISIARALALEPTCIICDEIVSSLDVSVQAQVLNLLNRLKRDFNLTFLFITHDLSVAKFMSDRLLVMDQGQIVEQGNAQKIFSSPQHPYTQALLQAIPSGELTDILSAQEKRKAYKASIDE
ncbi:ABC transporter ATP-binding protein [Rufibacter tibetensis]|uniref:ABC transporter ATP-binding protein n=1 Tax=Rufibacter tibetensis TaxID=512763 RepID=A0A0P0CI39_9BACT|nr:ABC transporter ATP-binding protein [Rufibacter tibetensis]ALI98996.1 ABC transporter ATP-binding protein [Rufibacter tibetensis]